MTVREGVTRRAPVSFCFLLLADAVPGIVSGCNCSVLLFPSVFVLYPCLGSSSKCALIGMPRRSARVAARLKEQSSRTQNEDEDDDSGGPWCCCRQPQGDKFMIECDLQGEKCFHWYHGHCVGITPAEGRRLESQGEPFICPFCTTIDSIFSVPGIGVRGN